MPKITEGMLKLVNKTELISPRNEIGSILPELYDLPNSLRIFKFQPGSILGEGEVLESVKNLVVGGDFSNVFASKYHGTIKCTS
jgi:hypothetical protein